MIVSKTGIKCDQSAAALWPGQVPRAAAAAGTLDTRYVDLVKRGGRRRGRAED